MQLFDWTHRIDLQQEIQEIYLHRFLFKLALGTITIFLPLYLYELGLGIAAIVSFFAVFYGTFIVASWPVARIVSHIGYKHTAFLSSPLILAYYVLLRALETPSVHVYGLAVIGGVGFTTYWIGMNSELARSSHDDHREKETGYFFSIPFIASIISPFIGGLVLSVYSFDVLFLLTAALVAVSYTPFLLSSEHYSGMELDTREIFSKSHMKDFFVFYFRGANGLASKVLWPLYLAVVITGSITIGGAGSIMALGSALVNIFLGQYVTKENRGHVMLIGASILAVLWVTMAFITTPFQAFIVSFASGIFYYVVMLPLFTEVIGNAEQEDILEYFAFREIGINAGRLSVLALFALFFTYLPIEQAFLYGFSITAVSALGIGLLGRHLDEVR